MFKKEQVLEDQSDTVYADTNHIKSLGLLQ